MDQPKTTNSRGYFILFLSLWLTASLLAQSSKFQTDSVFFENGRLKSVSNKYDGELINTVFFRYDTTGKVVGEMSTKFGKKYGRTIWYYPDGKTLLSVETYYDGEKDGNADKYYPSGKLQWRCNYKYGRREGLYTSYYENGEKQSEGNFRGGKIDGVYNRFHKNGKLWIFVTYKDGLYNGPTKVYDENGQVRYEAENRDGKMFGLRMCYDSTGSPVNGHFTLLDTNGDVEREGDAINGKLEGELKSYVKGVLIKVIQFKGGLPDGRDYTYPYNSKDPVAIDLYKKGKFVREIKGRDKENR